MIGRKLVFVVTEDWYFWSHRLPSARAALALGYEVALVTRPGRFADAIRAEGIAVHPWPVIRGGTRFLSELRAIVSLFAILRRLRPDVIHNVALKPVVYGTIAGKLAGISDIVNSVTGLGFFFASKKRRARLAGAALLLVLRRLARLRRTITICQNEDDAGLIFSGREGRETGLRLIRGSGVDIRHFTPMPEPGGVPVAALVARMLWEKGVGDLVAAAAILKERHPGLLRIVLVGAVDRENPGAIFEETLKAWQENGLVEWWGPSSDIVSVWRRAHIAVLPSFREGLPKALLEAAACGRPIVTTDVPGCRETVEEGVNGFLVPLHDAEALATALYRLAVDPELRERMGQAGRARAVSYFSDEVVSEQLTAVYREIGARPRRGQAKQRPRRG